MAAKTWFDVDKDGLAQIVGRRGLEFVLFELLQNSWDTATSRVDVTLTPVEGRALVDVSIVDDDPDGFRDLAHAYTLFAASDKKTDPTKRGRFNLGEKLVLSICETATVTSTKGSVSFDGEGRHAGRRRRETGTEFRARMRMTRAELHDVLAATHKLLPPVPTYVNDCIVETRVPLRTFEVALPTEIAADDGYLRRSSRKATVRVYARVEGQPSRLYEMGIPVVDLDDPWDVEIMQKIPLNAERDNVTPAYLREVRVAVVNEMQTFLKPEDATSPAVQEALADKRISNDAVEKIVAHRYGDKRVVFDPHDREANQKSVAEGYAVIPGGAFSKGAWENIKRAGAARPAGHVFPSPDPYSKDPDAPPAERVPEDEWTSGMRNVASYSTELAKRVLGLDLDVRFEKRRGAIDLANYGKGGSLCFNVGNLPARWFDSGPSRAVNDLLIHELAHEFGDHLTAEFDHGLSRIGAAMTKLALDEPGFFRKYGYTG
jgi:hypothetical protein